MSIVKHRRVQRQRPRAHPNRTADPSDVTGGLPAHAALRALQRSAGNAAVTSMLQGAYPAGGVASDVDPASEAMYVKLVDQGRPDQGNARVLGLSTPPSRDQLQLPEVHLDSADGGGVRLRATPARDSDDFESVSYGPGVIMRKNNVHVDLLATYARVVDPDFPPGSIELTADTGEKNLVTERMTVVCEIDQATAAVIQAHEQEHPNDFARAFEVSAGEVARVVTTLAGQTFGTPADAVSALTQRLDARLVPEWLLMPEAWPQHLSWVLQELYDLSKERDRKGEHNPIRGAGTLDRINQRLQFSPVLGPPGRRPTASWITLDNAKLPRQRPQLQIPGLPWPVGQGVVLTRAHTSALVTPDLQRETEDRDLKQGTFGTIFGHVIHEGKLKVRIDLEDGNCLLLEPNAAKGLLQPGVKPQPTPSVPAGPVTLALSDTTRIRDTVTRRVAFFETVDAAKDTQPRKDDLENGPGKAFADETLTVTERLTWMHPDTRNPEDAYVVSKSFYEDMIYALVFATEVLPAGGP